MIEWPRTFSGFQSPSDFAGLLTVWFTDNEEGRRNLRRRLARVCALSG